jgi:hypothetical protein
MPPRSRRHVPLAVALSIVAITAVMAHVCVLPVHAHAVPIEGHGSHDADSSENSVHTASCDALKTGSPTLSMIPIAASSSVIGVEPFSPKGHAVAAALVGGRPDSPPLFLLHAALLI